MSKRTIAKFGSFVILAALGLSACGDSKARVKIEPNPDYAPARITGRIVAKDIVESSGIAVSRCQPNVMWTHNDSGDDAYIFALDLTGKLLGTYRVENAENKDWEDLAGYKDADGRCYLIIGEIGDNELRREEHTVYRVPEPAVPSDQPATGKGDARPTSSAEVLTYRYPGRDVDAETIMVHPATGDIYVLSKNRRGPSGVFKIKPSFGASQVQIAEKVAEVSVPSVPNGFLTGGDIAPDGRRVILCDYLSGYELTLPEGASGFDAIWSQPPVPVDLGKRDEGESVAYTADGAALLATSEGANEPVFRIERKK